MSHPIDHTGKRYGRLTAIRRDFDNEKTGTFWVCRCDCGNEKTVNAANLQKGRTLSCGCLQRERTSQASMKHGCTSGHKKTAEYTTWRSMLNRCEREDLQSFSRYGGRGIRVCERWHSFEAFLADMGLRPSSQHQLDRIDGDGNYEPGNVRWVTAKENCRNKSNNRLVEYSGVTKPLISWCEELQLHYTKTLKRLNRGKAPEEAFAK
jgi:hypothetical protein